MRAQRLALVAAPHTVAARDVVTATQDDESNASSYIGATCALRYDTNCQRKILDIDQQIIHLLLRIARMVLAVQVKHHV